MQVFRENEIDGDALPLLAEHHLVEKMGLKLGHALKLIARVHRRLGTHYPLVTNHRCSGMFSYCSCQTVDPSKTPSPVNLVIKNNSGS